MVYKLKAGLLLIFSMVAIAYLGSPYWAIYQANRAIQEKNVEQFNDYVDYGKVRAHLGRQLTQREVAAGLRAPSGDVQGQLVEAMVARTVTPKTLPVVLIREVSALDATQAARLKWDFSFGVQALEVHLFDPEDGVRNKSEELSFLFERSSIYSFSWKLTGLALPYSF